VALPPRHGAASFWRWLHGEAWNDLPVPASTPSLKFDLNNLITTRSYAILNFL
jgi:hypothetical protein